MFGFFLLKLYKNLILDYKFCIFNKKKFMKNILIIVFICLVAYSCCSSKRTLDSNSDTVLNIENDTVIISDDKLEYDIIIIEHGFNTWFETRAKPEEFYSLSFLESKNIRYVVEWNSRVLQPLKYSSNLYEMQINYTQGIDYGFDLNYKLYNYFTFFQNRYNQNLLGGRVPIN